MNVEKLAPVMRQAGDLLDPATAVEILEPGIAVGMLPALEVPEVLPGPFALAILGEAIPGRRGCGVASIALIAESGSQLQESATFLLIEKISCFRANHRHWTITWATSA